MIEVSPGKTTTQTGNFSGWLFLDVHQINLSGGTVCGLSNEACKVTNALFQQLQLRLDWSHNKLLLSVNTWLLLQSYELVLHIIKELVRLCKRFVIHKNSDNVGKKGICFPNPNMVSFCPNIQYIIVSVTVEGLVCGFMLYNHINSIFTSNMLYNYTQCWKKCCNWGWLVFKYLQHLYIVYLMISSKAMQILSYCYNLLLFK